jgi:site-specific DNA recombinase
MQESANRLRAALYCRVSTEEQREGQTIESQIAEIEKFATERNWLVIGRYKDDGWSGSLIARPELDRLRDDASKGLFEIVLINDVDRLARDVTHLGVIKRDLERNNVRVIFRKLPNEQSPTQNLLVNILGSFAEFEREMIADRTRRGRRHKVEVRKQFIGTLPAYGFRYVRKQSPTTEGRLEVRAEEAAVVRKMYSWVDQEGLSVRRVLDRLNKFDIPPRNGGSQWGKSSVLRILRNEMYAGVWHYNKHKHCEPLTSRPRVYRKSLKTSSRLRPRTEWLPVRLPENLRIVDPLVWQRVQEQINRNIAFSPRNSRHQYFLQGLVRCGGCKASYVGEPSKGAFSYRCSKRCKAFSSIREPFLNDTVWNAVADALQNPQILIQGVKAFSVRDTTLPSLGSGDLKQEFERLAAEEKRILEAYRLEILSAEQLQGELSILKKRKTVLAGLENKHRQQQDQPDLTVRSIQQYCQLASERIKELDWQQKRVIVRHMLKQVIFEGTQVRLVGVIVPPEEASETNIANHPNILGPTENKPSEHTSSQHDVSPNSLFATTTSCHYGRKHALEDYDNRHAFEITFELVREVHRDLTAKLAACRANLIKASRQRWPQRRKC